MFFCESQLMDVPVKTYQQQLCVDTGCCLEDLPKAMEERDGWRMTVREIHVSITLWILEASQRNFINQKKKSI